MKSLFFILVIFSSFSLLANETLYVAPVQGTNVSESETQTLRELIQVEVQSQGKMRPVGKMEQATYYLQTKIIKFNNYTLSMVRWQGNKQVAQGQWRAKTRADLETQVGVAVREILHSKQTTTPSPFKNKQSLGEQAEEKKQKSNFQRVRAKRQALLGFGPTWFEKMNSANTGIGFSAGYVWNIDDHFDLGLKTDFAISTQHSDAYMASGKIFTNYLFAAQDISPFVGAGFGYGFASIHEGPGINDDGASGFALALQAGIKFFRTSHVNLAIAGEYTTIFDESTLGQPGSFMLRVALLY